MKEKKDDLSFWDNDIEKKKKDPLSELKFKGKNKKEQIDELVKAIRYILSEDE